MVSLETFRKLAMALPEVREFEHFKLAMFGVRKKNFASFDPRSGEMSLRLPLSDPDRIRGLDQELLAEIPGRYGNEGWTLVRLERIGEAEFTRLLRTAHQSVSDSAKSVVEKSKRAV